MNPLLRLDHISKTFGDKKILDDLSLSLYPGEIVGLIGKSGSGKSTLIKIIVGYYAPDKGSLAFDNQEVTKKTNELRSKVGYTTQENSFYEKLTIEENMNYYATLYRVPKTKRKTRITYLLDAIELTQSKNVLAGNISGGMKRRLDFAISLLHQPRIVILDEPTTGLDPILVRKFWTIVTTIAKEEHIAVLVSTHILTEISTYCDKVIILNRGKVLMMPVTNSLKIEKEFEKIL